LETWSSGVNSKPGAFGRDSLLDSHDTIFPVDFRMIVHIFNKLNLNYFI
jgi:hypothetical protein